MQLIPRDNQFYDLFAQVASRMSGSAALLHELFKDPKKLDQNVAQIKTLEHEADNLTHDTIDRINRTFVTPLDREDIADLAHALDDVLDFMEAALTRMLLFKLRVPSQLAQDLARIVLLQCESIRRAVPMLRHKGEMERIHDCLVEINRLENEGDRLLERALASLYDDVPDLPALVERLKWRDVYELLETATDRAEDVANVLESIVLKHA